MKATKRLINKGTLVLSCASLMLVTVGAWQVFADGETLQATEAAWGKPAVVQKLDNGLEKHFYKIDNTMNIGYRYFTFKDGRVIDDGTTNIVPEKKRAEKVGLPVSELSKTYYSNRPTTTAEIDQTWGKPVAVRPLGDGSEERYYNADNRNTMKMGYRHFVVKDGKVVASGITNIAPAPKPTNEPKGVPKMVVNNTAPKTVAEIENVWGKPVGVKNLANGMEERYYNTDNRNTMKIGTRMFLFKDGKAVGTTTANYF